MSLLLLLEDFNVLMLTDCKYVDCHVELGDNLERFCKLFVDFYSILYNMYTCVHTWYYICMVLQY